MLNAFLSLRLLLLVAVIGCAAGAGLMFWLGGAKLVHGAAVLAQGGWSEASAVTAAVMGATDALLFGIVLAIFAFAILFGFVLDLGPEGEERLPAWMRVGSIGAIKHTLVEVILVYLVVDFATDVATAEGHPSLETLVVPVAALLIAGALRLMAGPAGGPARH